MIKRLLAAFLFFFILNLFILPGFSNDLQEVEIQILLDQKITLMDGTTLSANIYKPDHMPEPLPAIFAFTPYISDEGIKYGDFFARKGYVYVHADVRGRGNSEGEFTPILNDGVDGAQVVDWIAKQPWCNGQVAMRGGSYRGGVQWQILKNFPKPLKTIVPTASVCLGVDVPLGKNIFSSYTARWLAFTSQKTPNINLFINNQYWANKYYKMYSQHIPYERLAEITGSNQKAFALWISHPLYDNFWKQLDLSDKDYSNIDIPVLTITGYFDGDQPGALHYYSKHMKKGTSSAKENHYLVIGPWDHPGTRNPRKELGGLVFADNSVIDINQLHLDWYDWVFKGKEKPKFLKKRICYYLMGESKWKYADSIEELSNHKKKWYLSSSNGSAHDVFHSGSLSQRLQKKNQKPDTFKNDPLKLISKKDYIASQRDPDFMLNQEFAFQKDKLIYHSPPLKEDIEVAGYVKLTVFLSMNVPDTDLQMALYEIKPNGKSIGLASDMVRARFRNSLSKAELVKPGRVYPFVFDQPFFFARKIPKGSCLRLIISGINSPDWQKNYNSGGDVSKETAKDARKAIIKLFHNSKFPSHLELPVKIVKK
jgi:putative CocE/NonD family hydrolase